MMLLIDSHSCDLLMQQPTFSLSFIALSLSCVAYTMQCAPLCPLVLYPDIMDTSSQAIYVDHLHKQFFSTPLTVPQIVSKAQFLGTRLCDTALRMSHAKVAPEGLSLKSARGTWVGVSLQSRTFQKRMFSKRR